MNEPAYRHIMDWDRHGRKGQRCEIIGGESAYVQVRFMDGVTKIVNRQALRRALPSELKTLDANDPGADILSPSPMGS